jgi:hypothetical protein
MPLRTAGLLTLATGLVFPALGDAPATIKYRIDQSLTQEMDATAAGGPKERIAFTTSSFVTVTLADSAGGKVIRVVVDSVRGDSATPIPPPVLDSARGAEFRGFLQKSGKPSDTTAQTSGTGPDSVTVRRVSAYRAAANETRESRKAVRVNQDFSSFMAGTQPTPNGPARIEGTGSGKGSYYVGPDGRYLGGSWQQQSALKISGSFAPQPLPVTIVQKTKVSTLT